MKGLAHFQLLIGPKLWAFEITLTNYYGFTLDEGVGVVVILGQRYTRLGRV